MGVPIYVICCFSLAAYSMLSLIFVILQCLDIFLWVNPIWGFLYYWTFFLFLGKNLFLFLA